MSSLVITSLCNCVQIDSDTYNAILREKQGFIWGSSTLSSYDRASYIVSVLRVRGWLQGHQSECCFYVPQGLNYLQSAQSYNAPSPEEQKIAMSWKHVLDDNFTSAYVSRVEEGIKKVREERIQREKAAKLEQEKKEEASRRAAAERREQELRTQREAEMKRREQEAKERAEAQRQMAAYNQRMQEDPDFRQRELLLAAQMLSIQQREELISLLKGDGNIQ